MNYVKPVSLRALLVDYALEHDISRGGLEQLWVAVTLFERHLGRTATTADLFAPVINEWLVTLAASGRAAETVRSKRRAILTLWRDAVARGHLEEMPARIRPVRTAAAAPNAWDLGQLKALVAAGAATPGRMYRSRVAWAVFWPAFVLVGYHTALRRGDLLALRFSQIDQHARLVVVQHKTRRPLVLELPAEAAEAVRAIERPARARIFGDLIGGKRLAVHFRRLVQRAGLVGSSKWLRRSAASLVEQRAPGSAAALLGHSRPGLDRRHYVDPRIAGQPAPRPPALRE